MTDSQMRAARLELARLNERAERAAWYGDPAGAAYARAAAHTLRRRIVAEMSASADR